MKNIFWLLIFVACGKGVSDPSALRLMKLPELPQAIQVSHLASALDLKGKVKKVKTIEQGKVRSLATFDSLGRMMNLYTTSDLGEKTRVYGYDKQGRLEDYEESMGGGYIISNHYEYDSLGRLKSETLVQNEEDPYHNSPNTTIYYNNRNLVYLVEHRKNLFSKNISTKKEFSYDEQGRMIKTTLYNGCDAQCYLVLDITYRYDNKGYMIEMEEKGMQDVKRTYSYNEWGDKIAVKTIKKTEPDGSSTIDESYIYDKKGLLIEKKINNPTNEHGERYEYDNQGNWIKTNRFVLQNGKETASDTLLREIEYW